MQPRISVIHLVWIPYGIQLFKEFVESYKVFSAGCKHDLVFIFNGVKNEDVTLDYHHYIQQNAKVVYQSFYYPKGQDLEVYYETARKLSSDYILFLNSFTRFLANNWLQKYAKTIADDKVGLVGATGSWLSIYSSILKTNSWRWAKAQTLKKNVDKYVVLLKAILLWHRYYKPFPNPHVRTNAFFIKRELFLSISYQYPKTKYEAYRIESGRRSITQQVLKRNMRVLLIDKHGTTFEADKWSTARIFWSYDQEHLLMSDNQTEIYANSDSYNKSLLETLAWGKLNL